MHVFNVLFGQKFLRNSVKFLTYNERTLSELPSVKVSIFGFNDLPRTTRVKKLLMQRKTFSARKKTQSP